MEINKVIKSAVSSLKQSDIALFTTGLISRRAFSACDRGNNFYMLGSMGLISSFGLGIALNTRKKVVIFDGDGSLLMDMGTMAMVAAERPVNLIHLVLDNQAYESTGRQPTLTRKLDLCAIARSSGYRSVFNFSEDKDLSALILRIKTAKGPVFISVKVRKDNRGEPARVSLSPQRIASRLKATITSKGEGR